MLTHKELAKHIRHRLAVSGIKAKCSKYESCGAKWIKVSVPEFEARFTDAEQREIAHIAKCNGMTYARGMEIDVARATHPMQFTFECPNCL